MNSGSKFLFSVLIISIFGLGLVFAYSHKNNLTDSNPAGDQVSGDVAGVSTQNPDQNTSLSNLDATYIDKLAQYLSDSGMIFYGAYWDTDTVAQKKLFGDSITKIDYVECDQSGADANPDECAAQNISKYPTWVYGGKQYQGAQTLADLAKITGFAVSQNAE